MYLNERAVVLNKMGRVTKNVLLFLPELQKPRITTVQWLHGVPDMLCVSVHMKYISIHFPDKAPAFTVDEM